MASVYVTFPVNPSNPTLHKQVVIASWWLWQDARGHKLRMQIPAHKPFENNLHHCVRDLLKGGEDYWLSIDSDNPPRKNPLELIDLNLDIVGLPTPVWHYLGTPGERPVYWNAYDYVPAEDAYREHKHKEGLQLVDAVGTGCFLVARRVFEIPNMLEAPFQRTFNADGTVEKGNDIAFCERARACGFRVWCHYDYPCRHYASVDLTEVVRVLAEAAEPRKGAPNGS